jgi:hypothetical protein
VVPVVVPLTQCQRCHPEIVGRQDVLVPGTGAEHVADGVHAPGGMEAGDVGDVGQEETEDDAGAGCLMEEESWIVEGLPGITQHMRMMKNQPNFFCSMTTQSPCRSFMFTFSPSCTNYLDLLVSSHPICAKKNPRETSWGSRRVSENLWCMRWSRDQW